MKKINPVMRTVLFLLLGLGVLSVDHIAYAKEDAIIIKIGTEGNDPKSGISLSPDEVTVKKETIVIWVNFIDGPELNVEFDDPKATIAATRDLKGFYVDDAGLLAAKYMPFVATASIRFIKNGTFGFSVTSQDGKTVATGKIIVE